VQMAWKAGLSDNRAHFRFTPGAHGGTVTAFDDAASELIDPAFARTLRPVALATVEIEVEVEEPMLPIDPPMEPPAPAPEPEPPAAPKPRARKGKPPVPAWEDVLLGVRSSGQR
jgi:hypothetical protein